jgi:hypothetical protein
MHRLCWILPFFLNFVVVVEFVFWLKQAADFNSCIETSQSLSLSANLASQRIKSESSFLQPRRKLGQVAMKKMMKNWASCGIADQRESMSSAGLNETCKTLFELYFPRFLCLNSSRPESAWFFSLWFLFMLKFNIAVVLVRYWFWSFGRAYTPSYGCWSTCLLLLR